MVPHLRPPRTGVPRSSGAGATVLATRGTAAVGRWRSGRGETRGVATREPRCRRGAPSATAGAILHPPTMSDSAPLVSVIIPNWNGARFLRPCLDSLRAQTYRPLEVIVAD